MTRQEIETQIAKRLGDPANVAFADRIWTYFIESLYAITQGLSEIEAVNISTKATGTATTNVTGTATISPASQMQWVAVTGVTVAGQPARKLDDKEYAMMKSNSFYAPSGYEAYYYYNGNVLTLLTGFISTSFTYEVSYIRDMHHELGDIDIDNYTQIPVPNTMIYRAMPETVNKLKQELGMML